MMPPIGLAGFEGAMSNKKFSSRPIGLSLLGKAAGTLALSGSLLALALPSPTSAQFVCGGSALSAWLVLRTTR
mgnify:CR=1 FL=1